MKRTVPPTADRTIDDDIVLSITEDLPHLPDCESVIAQCLKVERVTFNVWGEPRERLIFTMHVIDPACHEGKRLKMYAEFNPKWRYLPRTSKLRKLVNIAGAKVTRGSKLAFRQIFLNKIFVCELKHVGGEYSIIHTLNRRHVG